MKNLFESRKFYHQNYDDDIDTSDLYFGSEWPSNQTARNEYHKMNNNERWNRKDEVLVFRAPFYMNSSTF
jgi:hypothetical protein